MKKSKFLFPMDLQTFAGGEESVALTLLNGALDGITM